MRLRKIPMSRVLNYLSVFIVIAFSGFPVMSGEFSLILAIIIMLAISTYKKIKPITNQFIVFILTFVFVSCSQYLIFGTHNIYGFIGFLLKITLAFLAVRILRGQFINYYVKIMKFLAFLSLFIIIPSLISSSFALKINAFALSIFSIIKLNYGVEITEGNLIFYHFNRHFLDSLRNSGPFWESSAFGGYLVLAIVLNTLKTKSLNNKTNLILLITVLTTFSTTSYIALSIFIIGYLIIKSQNIFYLMLGILFSAGFAILYIQLPFLQNKVSQQAISFKSAAVMKGGDTRFGAAYLDIKEFIESPLVGRGMEAKVRQQGRDSYTRRHNGLTGFINSWGLIIFSIYAVFLFKMFQRIALNNYFVVLAVIVWLILNIAQVYFNFPVFWALMFYGMIKYKSIYRI